MQVSWASFWSLKKSLLSALPSLFPNYSFNVINFSWEPFLQWLLVLLQFCSLEVSFKGVVSGWGFSLFFLSQKESWNHLTLSVLHIIYRWKIFYSQSVVWSLLWLKRNNRIFNTKRKTVGKYERLGLVSMFFILFPKQGFLQL